MHKCVAPQELHKKSNKQSQGGRISPPFGYFGSKNRLALRIAKLLPPHNAWVEAFCGSAAVTLAKTSAQIEVINDIDEEIVNLFKQLRDKPSKLCNLVSLTPYSRRELEIARRSIGQKDAPLERARKFLVSSMMAINSAFGSDNGGFSYSQSYARGGCEARVNRWCKLPERLLQVVERLKRVRIEKRDAVDLLTMFSDKPATLVYLDPPYLVERKNGYTHDANDRSFHRRLLRVANRAKCMILISGYENDLYSSFLKRDKGWVKTTIKTYTKAAKGQRHERQEVLWKNRFFVEAERRNKIPVRLTKAELRAGKINPSRHRGHKQKAR